MPSTAFRHAVVGLGGIGSSAAYWLTRLGEPGEVLGLERFAFGHDRGASHDHGRIVRLSYHTADHVRLARLAYEAWDAIAADAGAPMVVRTGGVDLFPPGASIDATDYETAMAGAGVPFEVWSGDDLMRRYPVWRVAPDTKVLWQEASGVAPVSSIRDVGGAWVLEAGGVTYEAETLTIAVDAWTNDLLAHLGIRWNLRTTLEQVAYHRPGDPTLASPERFPVWIWMDDPSFYGIPAFDTAEPKIGQDAGGRETTGDTRSFDPDPAYSARLDRFVAEHLPGVHGPVVRELTCLYVMPPDREFVCDRVPGYDRAAVFQGAAHAYKFAGIFGRSLAELALGRPTTADLTRFSATRPCLTAPDPDWNALI
ncbi:MAG: FAD-dependent oxidoreductase [Actinomycetota bacterium]